MSAIIVDFRKQYYTLEEVVETLNEVQVELMRIVDKNIISRRHLKL